MKLDLHYVDSRLVELYDSANPRGADTDFYLQLATDLNAHRILDLGCGTGQLTRELAIGDRQVIGIEQVFGDWHCGPLVSASHFMVIIARRD